MHGTSRDSGVRTDHWEEQCDHDGCPEKPGDGGQRVYPGERLKAQGRQTSVNSKTGLHHGHEAMV